MKEGVVYKEGSNRAGKVIVVLILVILILLGVIAYTFVIRPTVNGYIIQKQTDAQMMVVNALLQSIQQNGFVQITDTNGNVITLVPATQQQTEASTKK